MIFFCQICAYFVCFVPRSTAKHPFFVKENQQCFTSSRDVIKKTLLRDRKRRKKQHLAGIEPTTSRVLLRRRKLYRCTSTTDQKFKKMVEVFLHDLHLFFYSPIFLKRLNSIKNILFVILFNELALQTGLDRVVKANKTC